MTIDNFVITPGKLLLFHGGAIPGIKNFRAALNETFGHGLYLTSDRERAESYALFRTQTEYGGECDPEDIPAEGFQATCYVFEASGRYFDLRTDEAMEALLPLWRAYLQDNQAHILQDARNYFGSNHVNLRELMVSGVASDITRVLGWKGEAKRYAFMEPQSYLNVIFSQFLQQEGYGGLVAIEGNDRTGTLETKKGDSWVVFDPTRARLIEEYEVVGELQ